MEQYGRREVLEISGIKETEDENCIEIALQISQTAKTDISINKIEIAYRIVNGSIIVTINFLTIN